MTRKIITSSILALLAFLIVSCDMNKLPSAPVSPESPGNEKVKILLSNPMERDQYSDLILSFKVDEQADFPSVYPGETLPLEVPHGSRITVWLEKLPENTGDGNSLPFGYDTTELRLNGRSVPMKPMTVDFRDDEGNVYDSMDVIGTSFLADQRKMSAELRVSFKYTFILNLAQMPQDTEVKYSYLTLDEEKPLAEGVLKGISSQVDVRNAVSGIKLEYAVPPVDGKEFIITSPRFIGIHGANAPDTFSYFSGAADYTLLNFRNGDPSGINLIHLGENEKLKFRLVVPAGYEMKVNGRIYDDSGEHIIILDYREDAEISIVDSLNSIESVEWGNGTETDRTFFRLNYSTVYESHSEYVVKPEITVKKWEVRVAESAREDLVSIYWDNGKGEKGEQIHGVNDGTVTAYTLPALTKLFVEAKLDNAGKTFAGWRSSTSKDWQRTLRIIAPVTTIIPLYYSSEVTDGAIYVYPDSAMGTAMKSAATGSEANPFTSLEDAMEEFHRNPSIKEIRLYEGAFRIAEPITIERSVTISGGWQRGIGQASPTYNGVGAPDNLSTAIIMLRSSNLVPAEKIEPMDPADTRWIGGGMPEPAPDRSTTIFSVAGNDTEPIVFRLKEVNVAYENGHHASSCTVIDENRDTFVNTVIIEDSALTCGFADFTNNAVAGSGNLIVRRSTLTSMSGWDSRAVNYGTKEASVICEKSRIYANNRNKDAVTSMAIYEHGTLEVRDCDIYAFNLGNRTAGISVSGRTAEISDSRVDVFQPAGKTPVEGDAISGIEITQQQDSDVIIQDSQIYASTNAQLPVSGIYMTGTSLASVNNMIYIANAAQNAACIKADGNSDLILFGNVLSLANVEECTGATLRVIDSDVLAINNDFIGSYGNRGGDKRNTVELKNTNASFVNNIIMANHENATGLFLDEARIVDFRGNAFAEYGKSLAMNGEETADTVGELKDVMNVRQEADRNISGVTDKTEFWDIGMFVNADPYNPNYDPEFAVAEIKNGGVYTDPQTVSTMIEALRVSVPVLEKDYIHLLYRDMRGKHRNSVRCTIGACQYL